MRTPSPTARGANARESRRFSRPVLEAIARSKMIGVRAGANSTHRFIGIWAVVVDGRVFGRSWMLNPDGWYGTFLRDPVGMLEVDGRQIRIRVRRARGQRIRAAVEQAYAAKYRTPGARKYVRGFRTPRRRKATIEFVPR